MARKLLDTYAMLIASPVKTNYWIDEGPLFIRPLQPSANCFAEHPDQFLDNLSCQNSDLRFSETFQGFSRL
mgnify:CR=1 FL=1